MASEAVVDLVVDASNAERDVQRQLDRIVRDAERGAPDINLDVQVDSQSVSALGDRAGDAMSEGLSDGAREGLGSLLDSLSSLQGDLSTTLSDGISEGARGGVQDVQDVVTGLSDSLHDVLSDGISEGTREGLDSSLASFSDLSDRLETLISSGLDDGAQAGLQNIRRTVDELGDSVRDALSGDFTDDIADSLDAAVDAALNLGDVVHQSLADGLLDGAQEGLSGFSDAISGIAGEAEQEGALAGELAGASFAERLGSAIGSAFSAIRDGFGQLVDSFRNSPQGKAIGTALATAAVAALVSTLGGLLSGVVIVVSGLTFIGLGAALLKSEPEIKAAATQLKDTVIEIFRGAAEPMRRPFVDALNSFRDTAVEIAPQIRQAFAESATFIQPLSDGVTDFVRNLMPGLLTSVRSGTPVFEGLRDLLGDLGAGLGDFFAQISRGGPGAGQALRDLGTAIAGLLAVVGRVIGDLAIAYGAIRSFVTNSVSAFQRFHNRSGEIISQFLSVARGRFDQVREAVTSRVRSLVDRAIASLRTLPGLAVRAIAFLSPGLASVVQSAGAAVAARLRSLVSTAVGIVGTLPGRARSHLGNLGGFLVSSGRALISGFISGIRSQLGAVRDAASSVLSAARDFFPFSPAKKGPFSGRGYTTFSGAALVEDFAKGMTDQSRAVASAADQVLRAAGLSPGASDLLAPAGASTAAASSPFFSPVQASEPRVNVYLGNELINQHIDVRIDQSNRARDRQAGQGVRF
jgi:hypothetical protein